eukprot:7021298-Alexandrium_andersonii.AAC.1
MSAQRAQVRHGTLRRSQRFPGVARCPICRASPGSRRVSALSPCGARSCSRGSHSTAGPSRPTVQPAMGGRRSTLHQPSSAHSSTSCSRLLDPPCAAVAFSG